jgi:hypothetical protein
VARVAAAAEEVDLAGKATVAAGDEGKAVKVRLEVKGRPGVSFDADKTRLGVHVALVQAKAETAVTGGVNQGQNLIEHRIVRALAGPEPYRGSSEASVSEHELGLPADVAPADLDVVAFVQDLATMRVVGVASLGPPQAASAPAGR